MKRNLLYVAVVAIAAATLVSCGTTQRVTTVARESDGRIYEPNTVTPFTKPLTAELEVIGEERINDTWTFDMTPSNKVRKILLSGKDLPANLKAQAIAKSASKHGADMIVAALFDYQFMRESITTGEVLKEVITITVTGYPAKFTHWGAAGSKEGDYQWISDFYGNQVGVAKSCPTAPTVNVTVTK